MTNLQIKHPSSQKRFMKTVLITGGSSGIGLEMSKLFAQDGFQLLWASKWEEELEQAKSLMQSSYPQVIIHSLVIDLSKPESAEQLYQWASGIAPINVLINNAGFGTYGYIWEIDMEKEMDMLHLNILTVYQLTRLFLNDMIERNQGCIINISSNSSLQPVPRMATYASTKAFVKHFSQSINDELAYIKSKVKVLTVCPSAIKNTKFQQAANMEGIRTFDSLTTTTSEEVAKDVYRAYKQRKALMLTGRKLRWSNRLVQVLPNRFVKWMLKRELDRI